MVTLIFPKNLQYWLHTDPSLLNQARYEMAADYSAVGLLAASKWRFPNGGQGQMAVGTFGGRYKWRLVGQMAVGPFGG